MTIMLDRNNIDILYKFKKNYQSKSGTILSLK